MVTQQCEHMLCYWMEYLKLLKRIMLGTSYYSDKVNESKVGTEEKYSLNIDTIGQTQFNKNKGNTCYTNWLNIGNFVWAQQRAWKHL